jgi:hypothetical protein
MRGEQELFALILYPEFNQLHARLNLKALRTFVINIQPGTLYPVNHHRYDSGRNSLVQPRAPGNTIYDCSPLRFRELRGFLFRAS